MRIVVNAVMSRLGQQNRITLSVRHHYYLLNTLRGMCRIVSEIEKNGANLLFLTASRAKYKLWTYFIYGMLETANRQVKIETISYTCVGRLRELKRLEINVGANSGGDVEDKNNYGKLEIRG